MSVAKQYRTLGRRLIAGYVDTLLFAPLVFVETWISRHDVSLGGRVVWYLFAGSVGAAYSIYFHGRFGRTLGKRLLGLEVIDVLGGPLTMTQAFRRELVNLSVSAWSLLTVLVAVVSGGRQPPRNALDFGPAGFAFLLLGLELLTARTSPRRRSLQDWLAGSVVVRVDAARPASGAGVVRRALMLASRDAHADEPRSRSLDASGDRDGRAGARHDR